MGDDWPLFTSAPHPTPLCGATFSQKWEKEEDSTIKIEGALPSPV
jgi:hypothetical protein